MATPSILPGNTLDTSYSGNTDLYKLYRAGSPIDLNDHPPGAATTVQSGTEGFPAFTLTFSSTVRVKHFFLLMQGDDTNNIWCELADIPFTSSWYIGANHHHYIFQGPSGDNRPYTSISVPNKSANTLTCWGYDATPELYISKIAVFGDQCIWDALRFSSFPIH